MLIIHPYEAAPSDSANTDSLLSPTYVLFMKRKKGTSSLEATELIINSFFATNRTLIIKLKLEIFENMFFTHKYAIFNFKIVLNLT